MSNDTHRADNPTPEFVSELGEDQLDQIVGGSGSCQFVADSFSFGVQRAMKHSATGPSKGDNTVDGLLGFPAAIVEFDVP